MSASAEMSDARALGATGPQGTSGGTRRVALQNLGCRVNRVECDLIARELVDAGCAIVDAPAADVVVLNTCAVTAEAEAKTRKAVRRMARLPQAPWVVATGCVATLFASSLAELSPRVVTVADKRQVVARVLELTRDTPACAEAPAGEAGETHAVTPTGRTRPGIKIQDGCDLRCSYCIVWKARGPSRSLSAAEVERQVSAAIGAGAREVVLTGINLGCYDSDGLTLAGLLDRLLEKTDIERIRLSSIEPQDVGEDLLGLMERSDGRVAPFLHVCLQSGCDATLRRMRRAYDAASFADVVDRARAHMPDVALGTDLICGFPGETDAEFDESLDFCRRMGFARMHVFRYSRRPGTPAAEAAGQVSADVSAARALRVRDLARGMRSRAMEALDGSVQRVLVEGCGMGSDGHLFEIDVPCALEIGTMYDLRLSYAAGRLTGEVTA